MSRCDRPKPRGEGGIPSGDGPKPRPPVALLVGCAVLLGGTQVLVSGVAIVRMVLRGDVSWVVLIIAVPVICMAWCLAVVLPLLGVRRLLAGRQSGAVMLAVAVCGCVAGGACAVDDIVAVFLAGIIAALLIAATVMGWRASGTARQSDSARFAPDTPLGSNRGLATATRLLIIGGVFGLHSFYMKTAWRGMLSLTLLALTFVSWDSLIAWVFATISIAMLVHDFFALPRTVEATNRA